MILSALLLAAANAASPAQPAGPLTWQWTPGEEIRYAAEMMLDSPSVIWFYGRENAQARMFRIEMAAQYVCTGERERKEHVVLCKVEDARLNGVSAANDQGQVKQILGEYQAQLKNATVELVIRDDGHIKLVDLEGVSKDLLRESEIQEMLRQLVRRSIAPLGMQAPRGGSDPGRVWRHKGAPAFFELVSKYGSSGGMIYEYKVDSQDGDVTVINGEGRATVATSAQREANIPASIGMVGNGSYRFDASTGNLAYAEVTVNGETTASYSRVGTTQNYGYAARMMRINDDGTIEGPDGPVQ